MSDHIKGGKQIGVRASEVERETLELAAKGTGRTLSGYVLWAALKQAEADGFGRQQPASRRPTHKPAPKT